MCPGCLTPKLGNYGIVYFKKHLKFKYNYWPKSLFQFIPRTVIPFPNTSLTVLGPPWGRIQSLIMNDLPPSWEALWRCWLCSLGTSLIATSMQQHIQLIREWLWLENDCQLFGDQLEQSQKCRASERSVHLLLCGCKKRCSTKRCSCCKYVGLDVDVLTIRYFPSCRAKWTKQQWSGAKWAASWCLSLTDVIFWNDGWWRWCWCFQWSWARWRGSTSLILTTRTLSPPLRILSPQSPPPICPSVLSLSLYAPPSHLSMCVPSLTLSLSLSLSHTHTHINTHSIQVSTATRYQECHSYLSSLFSLSLSFSL